MDLSVLYDDSDNKSSSELNKDMKTEILTFKPNDDVNTNSNSMDYSPKKKSKPAKQLKLKKGKKNRNLKKHVPQGDSILNFNPYKPPEFTEQYTLDALNQLGISASDLQYPSNEEISSRATSKRLLRIIRQKEYKKRDELIEAVKQKREEIISELQSNSDSPLVSNDINGLLFDDISSVTTESPPSSLNPAVKRAIDEALISKREENRKMRLQRIQEEKARREAERRIAAEEREKQIIDQTEQSRRDRLQNAYIIGVAREIKILSAREHLKEIESSREKEQRQKEEERIMREYAVRQRLLEERKREEEKMAEKRQKQNEIKMKNQNMRIQMQQRLEQSVEEKNHVAQQRLREVLEQKRLEAKETAEKRQRRAERAAELRKKREEENLAKAQLLAEKAEERARKADHEKVEKIMKQSSSSDLKNIRRYSI